MSDAELSFDELSTLRELWVRASQEARLELTQSMVTNFKDFEVNPPKLLYVGGPNHGWLEIGKHAFWLFSDNGVPEVGRRIHASPRYSIELARLGMSRERMEELGFRMEQGVYQLESLGDPCIAKFLGWYGDLQGL